MMRAEQRDKWEVAKDGHKYRKPVIFSTDRLERYDFISTLQGYTNFQTIPCGHCIECRLEKGQMWATRGYLESLYYEHNYFITLTYDDDHLPMKEKTETENGSVYWNPNEYIDLPEQLKWKGCLEPRDLELFKMKLIKIMRDKKIQFEGIRFLACGEYGDRDKRPHYHLILFNCQLPADSFYHPRVDWEKNYHWQNKIIEQAWTDPGVKGRPGKQKGIIEVCEANWNTINYVARYLTKKQYGEKSEEYYASRGQIPEFFRCSTRPGIGRRYYEDHKQEIYSLDRILIKNKKGSVWVNPPKYFDDLYEKEEPEKMKKIKEKRSKHMLEQMRMKDKTTSLTRYEQLQVEKRTLETKSQALVRPL